MWTLKRLSQSFQMKTNLENFGVVVRTKFMAQSHLFCSGWKEGTWRWEEIYFVYLTILKLLNFWVYFLWGVHFLFFFHWNSNDLLALISNLKLPWFTKDVKSKLRFLFWNPLCRPEILDFRRKKCEKNRDLLSCGSNKMQ